MSCRFAHDDGAYVLGALSPSERREFEAHLSECGRCTRAVQELAGLTGLMARADPSVLDEARPPRDPVPTTLLPTLLGEVRRDLRRRRTLVLGGVAAFVALVVGVAGVVLAHDEGPSGDRTGVTVVAGKPMTQLGQRALSARLDLTAVPWGTRLGLTCTYRSAGDVGDAWGGEPPAYVLLVRTEDGRTERVATWRAVPGQTIRVTGATDLANKQISSVVVREQDQQAPVLRFVT